MPKTSQDKKLVENINKLDEKTKESVQNLNKSSEKVDELAIEIAALEAKRVELE
jgi:outer membrane murein-binding lipoprotein Lpp